MPARRSNILVKDYIYRAKHYLEDYWPVDIKPVPEAVRVQVSPYFYDYMDLLSSSSDESQTLVIPPVTMQESQTEMQESQTEMQESQTEMQESMDVLTSSDSTRPPMEYCGDSTSSSPVTSSEASIPRYVPLLTTSHQVPRLSNKPNVEFQMLRECQGFIHIDNYKKHCASALQRQLEPLDFETFKTKMFKTCFYCGTSFAQGIDRVDNTRGYPDNSVTCCRICNYTKNKYTVEEFHRLVVHQFIWSSAVINHCQLTVDEESTRVIDGHRLIRANELFRHSNVLMNNTPFTNEDRARLIQYAGNAKKRKTYQDGRTIELNAIKKHKHQQSIHDRVGTLQAQLHDIQKELNTLMHP